jgi:uncharacterized membrane protein YqjE
MKRDLTILIEIAATVLVIVMFVIQYREEAVFLAILAVALHFLSKWESERDEREDTLKKRIAELENDNYELEQELEVARRETTPEVRTRR